MHLTLLIAIIFGLAFLALFIKARRDKESLRQAFEDVAGAIDRGAKSLEAGLLDRIHALENGGHLAAGTTAKLATPGIAIAGGTNGSQAPQAATAPTT